MDGSMSDVQKALRLGLRRLAKAVVIITCGHDGRRFAMAATAVSELSFDPPSMLICINKSASMHATLAAGADFAINILHKSQEHIAVLCSGPLKGEERFAVGDSVTHPDGAPYLASARASFQCNT